MKVDRIDFIFFRKIGKGTQLCIARRTFENSSRDAIGHQQKISESWTGGLRTAQI